MNEKKMSATQLATEIKQRYADMVLNGLMANGEQVLQVGSAEYAIPTLDANGDEAWLTVKLVVPKGDRSGEPYDGYTEAEAYAAKQAEKAEKAEKAKAAKAAKIERDRKAREAKAKAKAEREKAEKSA